MKPASLVFLTVLTCVVCPSPCLPEAPLVPGRSAQGKPVSSLPEPPAAHAKNSTARAHTERSGPNAVPDAVDALGAARIIGIVGENVVKASRGWVNLEPGSRPAFVGIQGGTAPITLLRSGKGSLLGYTGNTGNDFIQLLQGKEPPATAMPDTDSRQALELPFPVPGTNGTMPDPLQGDLFTGSPALEPFGLSTPQHVVQKEEAKPEPAARKTSPKKKKKTGKNRSTPKKSGQ